MITVCQALKDDLIGLGVPGERITVLRNGVDLDLFRPVDRAEARARVGVEGKVLLSVGYLIERKGHHIVIEALSRLPGVELLRLPSTGSFGSATSSAWGHAVVRNADGTPNVWQLQAGKHTIRMENVCGKGLNLDYVAFVPAH